MVGSAAGSDKMPRINEAYRVLSDPGRRAVYDAELRGPVARSNSISTERAVDDEPAEWTYSHPDGPARVPWRSLLFFSGIAIVAIVILAQFQDPAEPAAPDNVLR